VSNLQDAVTTTTGRLIGGRKAVLARRPLAAWRSIDIITTAMLGVAFGVGYWGWDQAYSLFSPVFDGFPPSSGLVGGVWLLAGVVAALVVRRPGAAVFAELVAASVELTLGNSWGGTTFVSGLLEGLGVELVFALLLYRRYGPVVAALAGAVAGVAEAVFEWSVYYSAYSFGWKLAYAGIFAVSGALISGVGGWLLTRGLAETGALSPFPPGQELHEGRATAT
jgi:energy-coupling factor transport system substrate-specific component